MADLTARLAWRTFVCSVGVDCDLVDSIFHVQQHALPTREQTHHPGVSRGIVVYQIYFCSSQSFHYCKRTVAWLESRRMNYLNCWPAANSGSAFIPSTMGGSTGRESNCSIGTTKHVMRTMCSLLHSNISAGCGMQYIVISIHECNISTGCGLQYFVISIHGSSHGTTDFASFCTTVSSFALRGRHKSASVGGISFLY